VLVVEPDQHVALFNPLFGFEPHLDHFARHRRVDRRRIMRSTGTDGADHRAVGRKGEIFDQHAGGAAAAGFAVLRARGFLPAAQPQPADPEQGGKRDGDGELVAQLHRRKPGSGLFARRYGRCVLILQHTTPGNDIFRRR
jgi:hypothetical protein